MVDSDDNMAFVGRRAKEAGAAAPPRQRSWAPPAELVDIAEVEVDGYGRAEDEVAAEQVHALVGNIIASIYAPADGAGDGAVLRYYSEVAALEAELLPLPQQHVTGKLRGTVHTDMHSLFKCKLRCARATRMGFVKRSSVGLRRFRHSHLAEAVRPHGSQRQHRRAGRRKLTAPQAVGGIDTAAKPQVITTIVSLHFEAAGPDGVSAPVMALVVPRLPYDLILGRDFINRHPWTATSSPALHGTQYIFGSAPRKAVEAPTASAAQEPLLRVRHRPQLGGRGAHHRLPGAYRGPHSSPCVGAGHGGRWRHAGAGRRRAARARARRRASTPTCWPAWSSPPARRRARSCCSSAPTPRSSCPRGTVLGKAIPLKRTDDINLEREPIARPVAVEVYCGAGGMAEGMRGTSTSSLRWITTRARSASTPPTTPTRRRASAT